MESFNFILDADDLYALMERDLQKLFTDLGRLLLTFFPSEQMNGNLLQSVLVGDSE